MNFLHIEFRAQSTSHSASQRGMVSKFKFVPNLILKKKKNSEWVAQNRLDPWLLAQWQAKAETTNGVHSAMLSFSPHIVSVDLHKCYFTWQNPEAHI